MRNRKLLKQKKATKLKNKKLLNKYPWLTPYNVWTGKKEKDYKYVYTWYDDIPEGWRKCFGKMLLEDLDKASHGEVHFSQIKEKWGELRMYASTTTEAQKVIEHYSIISRNVCIECGRPDIYMTYTGWQIPLCEKCFNKLRYISGKYEDYIIPDDGSRMPDSVKYTRFNVDSNTTEEEDLTYITKRIRAKYHIV